MQRRFLSSPLYASLFIGSRIILIHNRFCIKNGVDMQILPFLSNRVFRLYHGGAGIDQLSGIYPGKDGRFPENWIASCLEGNGRAYYAPGHGISRIALDGRECNFPEYLRTYSLQMLGEKHLRKYGPVPAVLVKLLDSSEQLPVQVHPNREDAGKYLNSEYGKTEAWLVLSTRIINGEKPYLLVGFNETLDKEVFIRETLSGKLERGIGMLNKLYVFPGDAIVISGGLPHAIGPGVTMVEIMEPSDWVILPESVCCGTVLTEKQRFMGLDPEIAVRMFDFTTFTPDQIRKQYSPEPKTIAENAAGSLRILIPPETCGLFSASELRLKGSWYFRNHDSCAIGVVTEGTLSFDGITLKAGESFFLPYALKNLSIHGHGRVILIRPPHV